ncbi:cobyrinic acid a,c-diamide synthase [Leptospira inadai serovar Lyme str. 10]|uniref:Cobyrinate a,c-diamide synthase n=2 Tax=Leptospira inadai serovar Lyme TaxID=293084 RepID=V6H7P9_9LEPT|nr:cobyrinate a,c-diamide synthase [Leptospira inadai]EQA34751.1 cobyrinic acid a,c-diamide synthase [Leptospira inadai serovar Lyme str. 10]PNV71931.1 cobyrinate a,c-diamide synthase [Leptospira inadai serovar Lyme]
MNKSPSIPRILIAGTGSGVGKTTTVLALSQAFRRRGLKVSTFKCGPDYLDPTYHTLVAGVTCQNLDGWLMGREAVMQTFQRASAGSDIAIIEGVMGLFDGASPTGDAGSSAEIAKWLEAPVLIVLDARGMARTIAPLALGLKNFDTDLDVSGVIANFVGTENHREILRSALGPFLPLVGGFPKSHEHSFPERHLGLRSAHEAGIDDDKLAYWGDVCGTWFDLDRIWKIASEKRYNPISSESKIDRPKNSYKCRIGLAKDNAFHFYYEDNLRKLEMAGGELIPFSPISDSKLPKIDGLYIGGGYPELFADALSSNKSLLKEIYEFGMNGLPIYAECGGLMYLSEEIETLNGTSFSMVGLIPAKVKMHEKLQALGYTEVSIEETSFLGPVGTRFRGHQFRYSNLEIKQHKNVKLLYRIRKRKGETTSSEGYSDRNVLGSYVHAHWASNPSIPENFVAACARISS